MWERGRLNVSVCWCVCVRPCVMFCGRGKIPSCVWCAVQSMVLGRWFWGHVWKWFLWERNFHCTWFLQVFFNAFFLFSFADAVPFSSLIKCLGQMKIFLCLFFVKGCVRVPVTACPTLLSSVLSPGWLCAYLMSGWLMKQWYGSIMASKAFWWTSVLVLVHHFTNEVWKQVN